MTQCAATAARQAIVQYVVCLSFAVCHTVPSTQGASGTLELKGLLPNSDGILSLIQSKTETRKHQVQNGAKDSELHGSTHSVESIDVTDYQKGLFMSG